MDIKLLINPGEPETLYQWDTDRQIEITDTEGLSVNEVHFSNTILTKALVVEPTVSETGYIANIPNSLLKTPMMIKVYVVAHTENGKHVTFCEQFEVNKRTKPSDYVYTETEVKRYENLEERIKKIEENGGVADLSGYLKKTELNTAIDSALEQAKESGAFDGKDGINGADGKDGTSVTITSISESTVDGGDNTVTFNDGTSLAVKNGKNGKDGAKGERGEQGEQGVQGKTGEKGADGKSAYEYAKDSGFSGTESEFSQKLATTLSENEINDLINTQLGVIENGTY